MPNWKKVITSGSAAELSSLYAPSITGSLLGTASYAVTASYITASGVYGPYGSNSVISSSYANFAETASSSTNTQDVLIRVLNQSGQSISKGLVVHITASGNSSDIPRVITASYENDNNSANTLGVTTEAIANGSEGFVMTEGVLRGINTSAFQSGQLIYLGATGSIIGTAPVAPLHNVRLGQVVREQAINGSIYVRIDNGYELEELHDVLIISASAGDLLVRDGNVWNNLKQLTGSYSLTGSLIITGSTSGDLLRITQTGTGNAFVVEDSTNPDATPFVVTAIGNVGIGTTSPLQLLHISSSDARVRLQSSTTNIWDVRAAAGGGAQNDFAIQSAGTRGSVYLGAYSTTNTVSVTNVGALVVNSTGNSSFSGSGNVGIGKTTPTSKLDVDGNVIITGSLTVSGSSTFTNIGPTIFSGSVKITGSTEMAGDLIPTVSSSYTLGSPTNPWKGIYIQSGSISIQSDTPGNPDTIISNKVGNIEISAGGMQLLGSGSFNASTGSFGYISGSLKHVGTFNNDGGVTITGSLIISGSLTEIGSTTISGSLTVDSTASFNNKIYYNGNQLFNYGQFSSTTSQSGSINVTSSFHYDTTVYSQGISVVSGSRITFTHGGIYNITTTTTVQITTNVTTNIYLWLRKNGSNINNNTVFIQGRATYHSICLNHVVSASAGDYFEVMKTFDADAPIFTAVASSANVPSSPSIITTVIQIA